MLTDPVYYLVGVDGFIKCYVKMQHEDTYILLNILQRIIIKRHLKYFMQFTKIASLSFSFISKMLTFIFQTWHTASVLSLVASRKYFGATCTIIGTYLKVCHRETEEWLDKNEYL